MAHDRALQLARVQDGLITRKQAVAAGMSPEALRHVLRPGGDWQKVMRGIYATFSGPLNELHQLRTAILHAGPESMITGPWACWMSGLRYGPDREGVIDVLVPRENAISSRGQVRVHHTTRVPTAVRWSDHDLVDHRLAEQEAPVDVLAPDARPATIPVVSTARAVVDTVVGVDQLPAGWQPRCVQPNGCPECWDQDGHRINALRNVRALLCEAVQRRRAKPRQLQEELRAAPRRGRALAAVALDDVLAGCRSAPECELRDLVRTSRILPEPRWNKYLPGTKYRIHPDACWLEARLVVEVDSRSFHGFGNAPADTERRRALYAELGWRVYPLSPARLRAESASVLAEIEHAYLAGLS